MALATDLLLNSASELRPKAAERASAKAAPAAPEPVSGKGSSFAKVLADERKAEAGHARRAEERSRAEKPQVEQQRQKGGTAELAEEPELAEDGNSLPAEEAGQSVLDPLLLLGLGVEQVTEEGEAVGLELQEELPVGATVAPVAVNAAAEEGDSLEIDPLLAAGQDKKDGAQNSGVKALTPASTAAADGAEQQAAEVEAEPEFDLEALSGKLAERLPEASHESANENQAAIRLNSLAQAVNQALPTQRAGLVGQPVAMNQSGWSEAIVDRVMLLSSQNLKSAEIQLDPAELGRLDIRVSLNQDQTLVSFSSPHAGVREALEAQMYRMREMLAQQGMGQVDVNVSDQALARNFDGQRGERDGSEGGAGGFDGHGSDEQVLEEIGLPQQASGRGLVDYYA